MFIFIFILLNRKARLMIPYGLAAGTLWVQFLHERYYLFRNILNSPVPNGPFPLKCFPAFCPRLIKLQFITSASNSRSISLPANNTEVFIIPWHTPKIQCTWMAEKIVTCDLQMERGTPQVFFCIPCKCSRCPPFVTWQTSIRLSISAHTRCSRSQSISEIAAKNRLHTSGRSRGTG